MGNTRRRAPGLDVRGDEWDAFMAGIEAKAKAIAQKPDEALALIILAGKVAQYDPTLAQALAQAVKQARREQGATRAVLRALTRKQKHG